MKRPNNEQLDKLKVEHGEVHLLKASSDEGEFFVVVKRPTRPQYKRFKSLATDEKRRVDAGEWLVLECLVHPSREDFQIALERHPGLGDSYAEDVLKIAGVGATVDVKKF